MADRKPRTADEMIKGCPPGERGRARTIYNRGKTDAATQLEELMYANATLPDADLIGIIGAWIKETREASE